MIPEIINHIFEHQSLQPGALEEALQLVMGGGGEPAQVAGLLVALKTLQLTPELLAAGARVLRSHRVAIRPRVRPLIDTCGTGGDQAQSFNISTAAAMVVAAAGGAVAKHGNRAVSSKVGSADVLEAAGCRLELLPEEARHLLDATGYVFLYAPTFHPAMRHVAPVRKSLKVRTLFNLLGPLANPALAEFQLLGVYDPELTEVVASALKLLGSRGALVVHCAGLDEMGLHAPTRGHRLREGLIEPFTLEPEELGLKPAPVEALRGGDVARNLELMLQALSGEGGPLSDVVALNAAAALLVAERVPDLPGGLEEARACLSSGGALRVLERYQSSSEGLAGKGNC